MSGTKRITVITVLITAITYLHYSAHGHHTMLHVLHRELYLIPIVLSAYWFGKKGGLTVAVLSSVLFLPKVLIGEQISTTYGINNILEIMMFIVVAYLIGQFQDVRRAHWRAFFTTPKQLLGEARAERGHRVMVCMDHSPNSPRTGQYVVDNFTRHENMTVAILGFIREPSGDFFANADEYEKARADNERTVTGLVEDAQRTLIEGGFPDKTITVKTITIQKESIAAKILEEQQLSPCDTIVVAGAKMSKTEEFIFGNVAVKLVRESDCSVVTVY
jgi:nucleotide-binding universal stress UspA family protein